MLVHLYTHPDCKCAPECEKLADELRETLANGRYDFPASILQLEDFDAYLAAHRTARLRAGRATRFGYTFQQIERADHEDDIYAINTSAPERQGRPMSDGYRTRNTFSRLPVYPCRRHDITSYGVLSAKGDLVAYLVLYVCGDLAMISQILGHAKYLADDIMYLLVTGVFESVLAASGPVTGFYNMHDSGTDGLRYFKERLGFRPNRVTWVL